MNTLVTPTINDTGIYIRLTASVGDFDKPVSGDVQTNPGRVFVTKTPSVITYGLAISHSFTYKTNPNEYNELMTGTKSINISMVFGGNNSAIRRSEYTINLINQPAHYDQEFTNPKELNSLMAIKKNENIAMNEVRQGSEEERQLMDLDGI